MPKVKRTNGSKQSKLVPQYKQVRRSTRSSTKEKDVEEDVVREERHDDLPTAKTEALPGSEEEELSLIESEHELLRQFDLNPDFGPSIDITRLERWERAAKYGKSPPQQIRELILKHPNNKDVSESIWSGYSL